MRLKAILVRTYAAALLAAISIGPSGIVQAAADERASNAASPDFSHVRIDNFGRINSNYYRGEQPDPEDYAALASLGIRTVIDLQIDGDNADEARLVDEAGMRFYRIPMTTHKPPTAEQLTLFIQLVNDPSQQPVYVHCAGGRHRTGVMTAVYRMTNDGWTADQAFKEMKEFKFGADFLHPEFKKFVFAYRPDPAAAAQAAPAATKSH